jgi:hypothetical protein
MVATILSMVLALVKFGSGLLNWLHEKQLIDGAQAEVTSHNLQAQLHDTRTAIQAREAERARAASGGLPNDDPFQRD